MRAQDKDNKAIDKLKQFFRLQRGTFKNREDMALNNTIEREISPDSTIHCRLKAIKDLSDAVLNHQWEDCAAEKLWFLVQDLIRPDVPKEQRQTVLHFLRCLVQGQYSRLSPLMRVKFFNVIKEHSIPEDVELRLELLQSLTDNGKDIVHLEEKMGPFLLTWMPIFTATDRKRAAEFLTLLVNVIKFNSACIDEDIISGLVLYICQLCYNSNNTEIVSASLEALDAIVCYSKLQPDSLQTFIIALCKTVNDQAYCQMSWKIMRNLLGTHMGHSALYKICYLLQEQKFQKDVRLLRGAVFYVNMGLWGTHRIKTLQCTPSSVLPSFYQALQCNHPIVMYEVTISIQRLVNKFGMDLVQPTWSIIFDIIEQVIVHTETSNQPATKQVSTSLHETITSFELLMDNNCYNGNVQRFYELVERCSDSRPEVSVIKLIDYQASMVAPTNYLWQGKLSALIERYYKIETRTNIRLKVLDVLKNVIQVNRSGYEDELIERIVVPHLQHVELDPDIIIRNYAANVLVDLCLECESKRCMELLDILERIINRPFTFTALVQSENEIRDVKSAVIGVIKILTQKVYRLPSLHAIRAYQILVNHLELHYQDPKEIFRDIFSVRYLIFECFLKARANCLGHLGFPDPKSGKINRYSPYLVLENPTSLGNGGSSASPPPASPVPTQNASSQITNISLAHACKAVTTAIKQEKDWQVLQLILKELPQLLQNRALILSRHSNDIGSLALALCSMIDDKTFRPADSLQNVLRNVPSKFTFSDLRAHFFPVLASCTSYHAHFDLSTQQRLIKCFEDGLRTTCASQCVTSLMTCQLEMRDTISKLVSNVLLSISKISDTVLIAIPILEFLSTLACLPKVYSNFTEDQYMAIFAIMLPYTKPTKYNHYTVSLAHHVIAVWFLKCRLPLRRNLVKYITKGLKTNAKMLLEEGNISQPDLGLNEDSSNRKRSSSLTEQGSRARKYVRENRALDLKPPVDKALMNFHVELTETCIDLMARYSYSMYSARPKRLLASDFLLKEGLSASWILGNKLITVTTSGCSSKAMRGPLCDNCWSACKASPDQARSSHSSLLRASSADGNSVEKLSRQSSGGHASSSANTAANSPTDENKRVVDDLETDPQQNSEAYKLEQIMNVDKQEEHQPCACWCQGWAEIYVRRPTGDTSWIMRIQNMMHLDMPYDLPLDNLTALYMPTTDMLPQKTSQDLVSEYSEDESHLDAIDKNLEHISPDVGSVLKSGISSSSEPIDIPSSPARPSPSKHSPRDSLESLEGEDDSRKSRNPVRRSNSSPEMSSNWKNPFLSKDKLTIPANDRDDSNLEIDVKNDSDLRKHIKNSYSKDMRVSCEAIPEEILGAGTTPPSNDSGADNMKVGLPNQKTFPSAITIPPIAMVTDSNVPQSPTNLLSSQLASKPPQSPTQVYARHTSLDLSHARPMWDSKPPIGRSPLVDKLREDKVDTSALPPIGFRDRGYTISVMSPAKIRRNNSSRVKDLPSVMNLPNNRNGISPSFIFLQLYHAAYFGQPADKPLLVPQNNTLLQTSITNFDRIQPYETHKIGVLYVGHGQAQNETEILSNQHGSLRYTQFLQSLGTLIRLKDADESIFLGGLDRNGENGNFAYIWQDDVTQVAFHAATLMPTKASDPKCTSKKQHIGNNYVTIVYNESGEKYDIQTVKGQFNYACVIIQPLDHGTNHVTVQAREELSEPIGHSDPKIISDQNLALLTRQLAVHANLASMVCSSLKQSNRNPYASNWLERLRHIKRLRKRVLEESLRKNPNDDVLKNALEEEDKMKIVDDLVQDFTDFTT
ncbi:tuberin [Trichogramma pretiosum]|uniref:tuberin n=1 Tax=Trichogramma pretiosum TaxID=7493 RepID=UPI0006C967F4|nr:tuberin [Trichogramma pretiosum]